MYEYSEALLKKYGVTTYQVAKATGISTASFTGWKQGKWNFKSDKLQRIADYFGVPLSYLLTGEMEEDVKETTLTPKDKRDIAKDLDNIMRKLAAGEAGPAAYDGEELDPEAAELFKDELELALRRLKMINKEKYTPKKYKK